MISSTKPKRSIADDVLKWRKESMMEEMYKMEERLKRHITEAKRDLIKELLPKKPEKKEKKDVGNSNHDE